jgi:dTDP-4-dehydrorhamnose 3,5-epimerase-like enzyme
MIFIMENLRDPQGPDHKPRSLPSRAIEGVFTQHSPQVKSLNTEDNFLTEVYRTSWLGIFSENEPIEHCYYVTADKPGKRTEWYWHEHSIDRYVLLSGQLDVGLYDSRESSRTFGNFTVISLGAVGSGLPDALRIPCFVWHSLQWNSINNVLVNFKTPPYNKDRPDKFRINSSQIPPSIKW